jgi:glycosyltransferase involved in cell wall biosynthesis
VHFVLSGAGEREAEWRSLAAGADVTFTGWLPAAELAYLLDESSLGLAAYSAKAPQGIPNKVIEYLSASLPVLSSLPGECRELLESAHCGAYYEAENPVALADAIDKTLANRERLAAMRAAARSLFEQRFSAEAVYAEMADHLEAIAAVGPVSSSAR